MNSIFTVVIAIIGTAVILLSIVWLGFQIEPDSFALTWEDEDSPWSYWRVEGIEYNINIPDKIPNPRGDEK